MLCYNLIIFLSLRQYSYLYYALYLLSLILTIYFENPVKGLHFLGMDHPALNILISFLGFSSTGIFYFLFGRSFLETTELTPKWDPWILRLAGVRLLALLGFGIYGLASNDWQPGFLAMNILMAVEAAFMLIYFIAPVPNPVRPGSVFHSRLQCCGGFRFSSDNAPTVFPDSSCLPDVLCSHRD